MFTFLNKHPLLSILLLTLFILVCATIVALIIKGLCVEVVILAIISALNLIAIDVGDWWNNRGN